MPLRAEIVRNKRQLVDKDPFCRHKFESLTLREYFDFAAYRDAIVGYLKKL